MVKLTKKDLGARNYAFCHFLKFALLVFLHIAHDCSLEQDLTSSRAETGSNWGQNEVFFLIY